MSEPFRCDWCGKFVSLADLESGAATRRMVTPDSDYSAEEWDTLCADHARRYDEPKPVGQDYPGPVLFPGKRNDELAALKAEKRQTMNEPNRNETFRPSRSRGPSGDIKRTEYRCRIRDARCESGRA